MMLVSASMVFTGSEGVRPVKRIEGLTVVLDTLYPMAMSPDWSMAMLPIQRKFVSGANVPCCATAGVPLGF